MDDFESKRKEICDYMNEIAQKKGLEVITKESHFLNDDVPVFLKELQEFEEQSSKNKIVVKYITSPFVY